MYLVRNADPSTLSSHLVGFLEEAFREMNCTTNSLTDGNQTIKTHNGEDEGTCTS
jgi:hypothetical protein